jgi:1,4-alpha-glucan branching enzyme
VFSFIRRRDEKSDGPTAGDLVCVANFAAVPHGDYRLGLPAAGEWREVVNTDAAGYAGSGVGNMGTVTAVEGDWAGQPAYADITVPPLATVWFRHVG